MDKLSDAQRKLFQSGGSLGDYDIVKPIGKGKFSVVYRAKRRRDDVVVALKKVNIFNLMDVKAREKTLKEVRLVQSVHHPNIIQYLDAFIGQDDELCIAFEWAEAGDLKRQVVNKGEYEPVSDVYSATLRTLVAQMLSLVANDRPTLAHLCAVATASALSPDPPQTPPSHMPSNNEEDSDRRSIASRESTPSTATSSGHNNASRIDATRAFVLSELAHDKLVLLDYPFQVH
ncbi:hypothetical protein DYB28_004489 [Aphanomyces astaci]|uniref:non-specific serine/threonine protein kinase n=1 Tax=Aphanomyces astaci TaxID=112090 RepID=A0A397B646_APHAT|nr:hypothetical protein DYB36_000979 [Aphanomyces astaci]RHY15744.1 hypothetical protein DYB25_000511 [Aphanomyces astaci]RHY58044.1 hypothetical protein DYB34_000190 [Aphanomyces astaci]RLO09752.1 hypothetical protein DYB28_004489 [Aphanomyces astaci]